MSSYKEVDSIGNIYWYKDGTRILHREDGPAVEVAGDNDYYYNNQRIDCKSMEQFLRFLKLKAFW